MRFVVFAATVSILSCSSSTSGSDSSQPFDDVDVTKVVDFYNSFPGSTWKAGANGFSGRVKLSTLKSRLGILPKQKEPELIILTSVSHDSTPEYDLPLQYDTRKAYPNSTSISSIKNQSKCGSCWAVSTAAAFSDRLYIASNGSINVNMSAEQLIACSTKDHGCNGGRSASAWKYIEENGLVTGGDYGSNEGCQPYSIPPHYDGPMKTPVCSNEVCPTIYKAKNVHKVSHNEYDIREEIYRNGPVTAVFTVYFSFNFYKHGIYSKFFLDFAFGAQHAVRIIGWGEENGRKYWIVANSWGRNFGENGTFRILRGDNECGIEFQVNAGVPAL